MPYSAADAGVPLPDVDDAEFAPFWAACREGRLVVQRCAACGRRRWPPRPACPACGDPSTEWVDVEPRARLYSWTVVHASPLPGYSGQGPYTVVVAELEATPPLRMLGRLAGEGALEIGLPLRAVFEPVAEGVVLPLWAPDVSPR